MNNTFILDGCDIDGDVITKHDIVLNRIEKQITDDNGVRKLSDSKDCRFCCMDLDCKYYFSKTGDQLCDVAEIIYNEKNRRK